jgi:hypothetical protein
MLRTFLASLVFMLVIANPLSGNAQDDLKRRKLMELAEQLHLKDDVDTEVARMMKRVEKNGQAS